MDAGLRAELLRRMEKDQAARRRYDMATATAVDAENLPWLKQLIAEVGWPGSSMVGKDGTYAAWLLVQHADRDPAFQRRCLDLLTAAAAQGEASETEVAYLTDRVFLAEGKPQVYGTQATRRGDEYVAENLSDPAGVDERRARVGLGPLAEYLSGFGLDGPAGQATMSCLTCGSAIVFDLPEEGGSVTVTCGECGLVRTIKARLV